MKNYEEDFYEESEKQVPELGWTAHPQEFGCKYCWDNRTKKDIEIYFFDRANNMRLSLFCPFCGRKY